MLFSLVIILGSYLPIRTFPHIAFSIYLIRLCRRMMKYSSRVLCRSRSPCFLKMDSSWQQFMVAAVESIMRYQSRALGLVYDREAVWDLFHYLWLRAWRASCWTLCLHRLDRKAEVPSEREPPCVPARSRHNLHKKLIRNGRRSWRGPMVMIPWYALQYHLSYLAPQTCRMPTTWDDQEVMIYRQLVVDLNNQHWCSSKGNMGPIGEPQQDYEAGRTFWFAFNVKYTSICDAGWLDGYQICMFINDIVLADRTRFVVVPRLCR